MKGPKNIFHKVGDGFGRQSKVSVIRQVSEMTLVNLDLCELRYGTQCSFHIFSDNESSM